MINIDKNLYKMYSILIRATLESWRMTGEMSFLRIATFVALLVAATSGVEEQPPNGFYLGFLANHPGFHGFNNPHFPGPATEPDTADTPEVETDQIDTNDGSGDEEITVDALSERQGATDEGYDEEESDRKYVLEFRDTIKVECDFLTQPRYSCHSCYDYLECKEKEGKVKSCNNPLAPYCVNGICSPTPSVECA